MTDNKELSLVVVAELLRKSTLVSIFKAGKISDSL